MRTHTRKRCPLLQGLRFSLPARRSQRTITLLKYFCDQVGSSLFFAWWASTPAEPDKRQAQYISTTLPSCRSRSNVTLLKSVVSFYERGVLLAQRHPQRFSRGSHPIQQHIWKSTFCVHQPTEGPSTICTDTANDLSNRLSSFFYHTSLFCDASTLPRILLCAF